MDPFEEKLNSLLENRIEHIEEYISSKIKNDFEKSEDVLPYNIVKTVQYIKQEEYKKRTKTLKKLSDY